MSRDIKEFEKLIASTRSPKRVHYLNCTADLADGEPISWKTFLQQKCTILNIEELRDRVTSFYAKGEWDLNSPEVLSIVSFGLLNPNLTNIDSDPLIQSLRSIIYSFYSQLNPFTLELESDACRVPSSYSIYRCLASAIEYCMKNEHGEVLLRLKTSGLKFTEA